MTGRAYPDLSEIERFIEDVRADPDQRREREAIQQERIRALLPLEWVMYNEAIRAHAEGQTEWQYLARKLSLADRKAVQGADGEGASNRLAQAVYNLKAADVWPWGDGENSDSIEHYRTVAHVAQELGITVSAVHQRLSVGRVPFRKPGQEVLIHKRAIPLLQAQTELNKAGPHRAALAGARSRPDDGRTDELVAEIVRRALIGGESQWALSQEYSIPQGVISRYVRGSLRPHIAAEIQAEMQGQDQEPAEVTEG